MLPQLAERVGTLAVKKCQQTLMVKQGEQSLIYYPKRV
jgi:hypothetical protein